MSLLAIALLNIVLSVALVAGVAAAMGWPRRNRRARPLVLSVESNPHPAHGAA